MAEQAAAAQRETERVARETQAAAEAAQRETERIAREAQEALDRAGREIKHNEVFIEWAEGSKMFPDKTVWQNPANFPALRVDENQPRLPCTFYNTKIKACTVHSIRPNTCAAYECDYLAKQTNKNKIK